MILSWSSGKDSAWSLWHLRQDPSIEVVGLLTTVSQHQDRVAMHGVRREILQAQAQCVGLPLDELVIPDPCPNGQYEVLMGDYIARKKAEGVQAIAFGDLYLEEIRQYREAKMAGSGLELLFPLWGLNTFDLAKSMISGGLKARLTCVDSQRLAADWVGQSFDSNLLANLPESVDPCGENGEFHTVVCDGPMFQAPLRLEELGRYTRGQFAYADFSLA